jgi:hypothetical protein
MNRETPRSLSCDSSRRDREELHTQIGTSARCPAFRISWRMSSPVYLERFRSSRIRFGTSPSVYGPPPADESESFASAQQVDQLEWEILLLQCPIEKEDIRVVVFNHKDSGREHNRHVFQAYSRRPPQWAVFIISHSMVAPFAMTPELPLRSVAWAPVRRSRKGNRLPASARSRLTERVRLHSPDRRFSAIPLRT